MIILIHTHTQDFEKKTFLNSKNYPINGIDGTYYMVGPVKLTLYARFELNNGAEMAVTTDFQDATDLFNGNWWECAQGGRAGFGKVQ